MNTGYNIDERLKEVESGIFKNPDSKGRYVVDVYRENKQCANGEILRCLFKWDGKKWVDNNDYSNGIIINHQLL